MTKNLVERLDAGIAQVHTAHPDLPVQVVRVVRLTDFVSRAMFARLDAFLADYGLNDTSWLFLTSIYTAPGAARSPSEVGQVLAQSKPHMTRLADRLLAKGLIRRAHSDGDRRRVLLAVTPKGRQLVERLLPQVWAQQEQIACGLSRADLAQLSTLLAKWLTHIETGASTAGSEAGRGSRKRSRRQLEPA